MKDSLLIEYKYDPNDGFDLKLVGESFVGFDALLKDILDTAHLKDKVEIKPIRIEHGSIDLYNALTIIDTSPFNNVQDFLDFLKLAGPDLLHQANNFFSTANEVRKTVNDYFKEYPADVQLETLIINYIVTHMLVARKLKKNSSSITDKDGTPKQINSMRRMIFSGRYKRALMPIAEGKTTSITLRSVDDKSKPKATFTESNIEDYLPDEAQILPEFINGEKVTLTGQLLNLQSAKGDEVKLRIDNIDRNNNLLVGFPAHGADTKDYVHLYKKRVHIEAEIYRKTLYKRPELVILEMTESQQQIEDNLGIEH